MENILIVLTITGAVILNLAMMVGILLWLSQRQKRLSETYERVAKKYNGTCTNGSLFKYPSVEFSHQNRAATLGVYSTGGKHPMLYTQLETVWPDSDLQFKVFAESTIHRWGKMLGLEDIEVGHPEFDKAFMLRGNHKKKIRRMFGGDVSDLVLKLQKMFKQSELLIFLGKGTLTIRKRDVLRDDESIEKYLDACLQMLDRIFHRAGKSNAAPAGQPPQAPQQSESFASAEQPSASQAIAPLPVAQNQSADACQFCGMMIEKEKDLVYCKSCDTAHHRGCWKCNGSCSMFGCKQRKFVEATEKAKA